jgi:methionine synthase II (cobalamin-independent)
MTGEQPLRSTGIGSWPGTDMASAIKIAFAECPDLPYLPELPARGSHAQLIGRSTALLAGLFVDLQPAGWRLTDGSGREHRQAIATLRADLDLLEEHAQGYQGRLKLAVGGPWTLAASIERPRGDLLLADHGARRDVCQSLAEGIGNLIAELRRRLPAVDYLVQLDEPSLPAVLAGSIPTASGFSRHRAVDIPEVGATLRYVIGMVAAVDDTPVAVHCCAKGVPIALLDGAGVQGIFVDVDQLARRDWDAIGTVLEKGHWIGMGALPTQRMLTPDQVARRVVGPIRDLGLEPEIAAQLLVTPSCGLAGLSEADALTALRTVRTAAAIVTEQLAA